MKRFTSQNLQNIEMLFEAKTGVDLDPTRRLTKRKWILVMAAVVCCMALSSCGYLLFSSLHGDILSLRGNYQNGVVSILVVNGSDKTLRFQEKVKLMSWQAGEIPAKGENPRFENTVFAPHSSGIMTIDLSQAYPMEELQATGSPNDLYLVLTNNDFRFGQDWICHFNIIEKEKKPLPTQPVVEIEAQGADEVHESLKFYFQDHYLDQVPAFNTANENYMVAVQELLSQQKGTLVRSMDPLLLPKEPKNVVFDSSIPLDAQHQLILLNHHSIDSFNRMVGSVFPGNGLDSALMLGISLPQYQGQTDGGIGDFKLMYYFTFPTQEIKKPDAYAFVYGRILTFPEMEKDKVFEDEEYTVYDLTDLFYRDLDQYLDDFISAYGGEVYMDEQIRQRVHNIYDYYRNRENLDFSYLAH